MLEEPNTYHIILKKDINNFQLPYQYKLDSFFINYEFYENFAADKPYIPNYSSFLSSIEMLAVKRVHVVSSDNWYTQIILRNMTKGDEVHLTLIGIITPDSCVKVPHDHGFYKILERDLPKKNEYFVINDLSVIPSQYFSRNVKFIHSYHSEGDGPLFWTYEPFDPRLDPPINSGRGYLIQLLVQLTEEDKIHLKLVNVPLHLEKRPERITTYNQVFTIGRYIERYNNLINVMTKSV